MTVQIFGNTNDTDKLKAEIRDLKAAMREVAHMLTSGDGPIRPVYQGLPALRAYLPVEPSPFLMTREMAAEMQRGMEANRAKTQKLERLREEAQALEQRREAVLANTGASDAER